MGNSWINFINLKKIIVIKNKNMLFYRILGCKNFFEKMVSTNLKNKKEIISCFITEKSHCICSGFSKKRNNVPFFGDYRHDFITRSEVNYYKNPHL